MAIEGMKISGSPIRVVTVRDLKQHHPASADQTVSAAAPAFVPSSVRFGIKKKRGQMS
jgi:hypothetical protein